MVYARTRLHLTRLLAGLQKRVLPPRCIACGGPGGLRLPASATLDLCTSCYPQLPFNRQACARCALPLQGAGGPLLCGQCLRRPPRYQRSQCAFEYAYPLAALIRNLKYGQALPTARVLGELLAQHLLEQRAESGDPWPDCILPVPLHAQRYYSRGYNQVIEVGRVLQQRLNIPLRTDLMLRHRATVEQAGLSRRERRHNLRRAFSLRTTPPVRVAVLDDVITTGSTVNEVSNTLWRAGVRQIEVWGLARAARHHL